MKNKNIAFTLIELLVVIVIIGILLTISISSFNGYIEKARIAKAQVFEKKISDAIARYGTLEEKDMFTAWFKGDNANDFSWAPYRLLRDNSGKGNHLTHGRAPVQDDETPTGIGKSMRFNSGTPYRYNGFGKRNYPSNKMTIATWVNIENIVAGDIWYVYFISDFGIKISPFGSRSLCLVHNGSGSICTKTPKANRWYYVVGSYNGETGDMKLWVDGDLVASRGGVTLIPPLANSMRVAYNFYGLMDELKILPHAFNGETFE